MHILLMQLFLYFELKYLSLGLSIEKTEWFYATPFFIIPPPITHFS